MARRPLVKGALILFISGLVCKVLSSYYRIMLARIVSAEALGLFQLLMPTFRLAITLSQLGLPLAIAQLTASRRPGTKQSGTRPAVIGLVLITAASSVTAVLLWMTSPWVADIIAKDSRALLPLKLLALAILPMGLGAGLRAWFQGEQNMTPNAVSHILEVVVRIPAVIFLVNLAAGGETAIAGAIALGLTIGELVSLVVLAAWRYLTGQSTFKIRGLSFETIDAIPVTRQMYRLSFPQFTSQMLNTVLYGLYVALIPRRLVEAGMSHTEALQFYGHFSGMAVPVLYLATVLVSPVTQMLLPALAERARSGANQPAVRAILRKSFIVGGGVGALTLVAMYVFGEPLANMLYGNADVAYLLRPLSLLAPALYMNTVAHSALHGLGRTDATLRNSVIGSALRVGVIYVLAGLPRFGFHGVIIALVVDYSLTAILNLGSLWRHIRENRPSLTA